MKKRSLVIAAVALLVTSVATFATINVNWSTFGTVNDPVTGTGVALGSLCQLIWTPTDSIDALSASSPLVPQGDDLLLDTYTIGDNGPPIAGKIFTAGGTYSAELAGPWGSAGTYSDDHFVGGYVYSRIFNSASPGAGTWYLDAPMSPSAGPTGDEDPAVGQPAAPTVVDPSGGAGMVATLNQRIGGVIPEPSTWAFMGIGFLAIVLRRRFSK